MPEWIECKYGLPPDGIIVMAKIEDESGVRYEQKLIRRRSFWFGAEDKMYVGYTPTHWRYLAREEK